ncbi:MAG: hypothetical protein ACM3H7_02940 [Acidobacteriaceae bacterium]
MINNLDYAMINGLNKVMADLDLRLDAVQAFDRAYAHGKRSQLLAKILRRQDHLLEMPAGHTNSERSTGRIITVPIQHIKGSLGRSEDFDRAFHPLAERSRARWVSLATAYRLNVPLPPVELVKVGQDYYVRDGHHRISVARAFGQEVIEARLVG